MWQARCRSECGAVHDERRSKERHDHLESGAPRHARGRAGARDPGPAPGPALGRPWAGYAGLAWAISYIPIHLFWALGGVTPAIGFPESTPQLRAANWGASVVIAGTGLICLALTHGGRGRIGAALPRPLLHGIAWIGGVAGVLHGVAFTVASGLRLAGVFAYPADERYSEAMMRGYDWFNLLYAEPWFLVMGVLLIAASRYAKRRDRGLPRVPGTPARRAATGLTLAGVLTVVAGVFVMNPWVFALYGPALTGAGLLGLYLVPAREARR